VDTGSTKNLDYSSVRKSKPLVNLNIDGEKTIQLDEPPRETGGTPRFKAKR
jgi:hypothetical protein